MGRRLSGLLLLAGALLACQEEEAEPEHPPEQVLRDSLHLTDRDPVYRVTLSVENARNLAAPSSLTVPRGAWVQFVTTEGWPRTVTFQLDSLPPAARELLRSTGQHASPPLLEVGARFVVTFEGAPAGRYPYRVEGSARAVDGVVVVIDPVEGR